MNKRFQFRLGQVIAVVAIVCAVAGTVRAIASIAPDYTALPSLAVGAAVLCGATIYLFGAEPR